MICELIRNAMSAPIILASTTPSPPPNADPLLFSSPQAVAAVVAGAAGLIVAIIGILTKLYVDRRLSRETSKSAADTAAKIEVLRSRAQVELEFVRAELTSLASREQADSKYIESARARLYSELLPLALHLTEVCHRSYEAVRAVADAQRLRRLDLLEATTPEAREWRMCVIHELLGPLAALRAMQVRLTQVDLSVDAGLAERYRIALELDRIWRTSLLTRAEPGASAYDFVESVTSTAAFERALLTQLDESSGKLEPKSLGEFLRGIRDLEPGAREALRTLERKLFENALGDSGTWFWLVVHAAICRALSGTGGSLADRPLFSPWSSVDAEALLWSRDGSGAARALDGVELAARLVEPQGPA